MPAYFIPLRRKIGVVTLLMACVFASGWIWRIAGCPNPITSHLQVGFGLNGFSVVAKKTVSVTTIAIDGSGQQVYDKHLGLVDVFETAIPYWSIIIPLTLLSAYLLLSKPQKKPDDSLR